MSLKDDLQTLVEVVVNPRSVIENLGNKATLLVPMVLVPLAAVCAAGVLFEITGEDSVEAAMEQIPLESEPTSAQQDAMRKFVSIYMLVALLGVTAGASIIGMLILAGYLSLVAPVQAVESGSGTGSGAIRAKIGFRQWLSLTAWANVPHIAGALLLILYLLVLTPSAEPLAQPFKFNPFLLGFWFEVEHSAYWHQVLAQINVLAFWVIGVLALGFSTWTRIGMVMSVAIVAVPFVVYWMVDGFHKILMAGFSVALAG